MIASLYYEKMTMFTVLSMSMALMHVLEKWVL